MTLSHYAVMPTLKSFCALRLMPAFGSMLAAGSAWSAPAAEGSLGPLEVASGTGLVLAALWLAHRLRAAHAKLRAAAAGVADLQKDLAAARADLSVAAKRHQQERQDLQARLQQEIGRSETAQRAALRSAQQDALTQLPNRARLQEYLTKAIAAAERKETNVAVMFVDLDDFKRVNDTLGHSVGDELLKQAAARLTACVRSGDDVAINRNDDGRQSVARVGGDEFVLLFPEVSDKTALAAVAERLIGAFRTPFTLGGVKVQTSISVGIACYPDDARSGDALLKQSDIAMYQAKDRGKDGYKFFSHAMSIAASRHLAVENGLRKALEEKRFVVLYQPKVEVGSYRVVGAEALVRWNNPAHGLVGPAHFMAVAEKTGLISPIGEWVIRQACRQQRAWVDAGLPSIQIAVNVSSLQFREDQLLNAVVKAIKETGITPQALQLEVTENLLMKNLHAARNTLDHIRRLGASVAIDDFGTGYSSFGYLRQLPVDAVKIDRTFVRELGTKSDDREIIRAIVALARALEVTSVAEGVETQEQSELLAELGCDEMQGFAFAPPVDARAMTAILQSGTLLPNAHQGFARTPAPAVEPATNWDHAQVDSSSFDNEATLLVPLRAPE